MRSLTLDEWEPSWIKLLSLIGNKISNQIFEEVKDESLERITALSSRKSREEWIRWKYVDKRFVRKLGRSTCANAISDTHADSGATPEESLNESLFRSTCEGDVASVSRFLAAGADVNWQNPAYNGASCLHQAVQGSAVEVSELLLLNGARVNLRDYEGRTAMHVAIQKGIRG